MIEAHVSLVLAVTGVLTLLAGAGILAPKPLFRAFFDLSLTDATSIFVARHWSLLIALVGALLLYAAYHPEARAPILVVAAAEKIALGLLVFIAPLRKRMLTVAIVTADVIMALLYVLILARGAGA
jgi:hypothetical protein